MHHCLLFPKIKLGIAKFHPHQIYFVRKNLSLGLHFSDLFDVGFELIGGLLCLKEILILTMKLLKIFSLLFTVRVLLEEYAMILRDE